MAFALVVAGWPFLPIPRQTTNPVVVYLGNETRPGPAGEEASATVDRWLKELGTPQALEAAQNIIIDRVAFPDVVDEETNTQLAGATPRVFIATNATLRAGHALLREERQAVRRIPIVVPPPVGDYVTDESPMATEAGLRQELEALVQAFPPTEHEHIVILKSHGRDRIPGVPRLTVRPAQSSPEGL